MVTDRQRRVISNVLLFVAAFTVAFWVIWYADRSILASNTRPAYYEFENAFPLADGWLALACAVAAITLRQKKPTALLWLIAAGSAGVYLAGMDILYDLENSIWWRSGAGGVIEAIINAVSLVGGIWTMRWSWTQRQTLSAGKQSPGVS